MLTITSATISRNSNLLYCIFVHAYNKTTIVTIVFELFFINFVKISQILVQIRHTYGGQNKIKIRKKINVLVFFELLYQGCLLMYLEKTHTSRCIPSFTTSFTYDWPSLLTHSTVFPYLKFSSFTFLNLSTLGQDKEAYMELICKRFLL